MANEITYTIQLKMVKDSLALTRELRNETVDMAGDAYDAEVVSIPTTASGTAITIATAIGSAGYTWFRNLDDTNYVEVGREDGGTFYAFIKLKPGEANLVRMASDDIFARSNTSACLLEYIALED